MSAPMVLLCLTLQGIICTVADHASFRVTQEPKQETVSKGENIAFGCRFSTFQDDACVTVHWWKKGETEFLRESDNERQRFSRKNKWLGTFQLLNTTFQDSGIYHCAVMCQGIVRGNGTGSQLIVYVPPTPLNIVSKPPEGNSDVSLTLMCETAAFYPENVTLTWYKNGMEIATGVHNIKVNTEGLYEVSSSLALVEPVPSGTNFTCSVLHASLQTPAFVTHIISKSNQVSLLKSLYFWFPGCAGIGLCVLVLMIVIRLRCRLQNNDDKEVYVSGSNRSEEAGTTAEVVHYAALDFGRSKKAPMRDHNDERAVYAQGTTAEVVHYAALDFGRSKKAPMRDHNDERTVYAQTQQGTARDELMYATLAIANSAKKGKCSKNEMSTEFAQLQREKRGSN